MLSKPRIAAVAAMVPTELGDCRDSDCCRFLHSVADVGLPFVTVQQCGPNIGLFKQPEIQRLLAHNILQIWMTLGEARSQNSLVLGYIGAATLFGRDGSPFITSAADLKMVLHNVRMGGVPEFKVEFMPDDSALVYMDAKVPLECESTHPVKIEQSTIDSNDVIEKPMKTTALVPNCTFRSMRPSGIYMSLQGQFRLLKLHLY